MFQNSSILQTSSGQMPPTFSIHACMHALQFVGYSAGGKTERSARAATKFKLQRISMR